MESTMTVAELVDDTLEFPAEVLTAMREFRKTHFWRGEAAEKPAKLLHLNAALAGACGIPEPILLFREGERGGAYLPVEHTIVICGTPSVVTFLHEFAHARGATTEREAFAWSLSLFKRVFPRAFERARKEGPFLFAN